MTEAKVMTIRDDFIGGVPCGERARGAARRAERIEGALTLRGLRQAQDFTQERLAARMGVEQENVSRLERRADLLLSTLSSYVVAMGGRLRLVAEFPNRCPVAIVLAGATVTAPPVRQRRGRLARKVVSERGMAAEAGQR